MSDEILVDGVPLSKLTHAYIKIRDKKSAIKKDFDAEYNALTEQQDKIKRALLTYLDDAKITGFDTEAGRVSKRVKTRYWTSDWDSMNKFILEHEVPEFYTKSLNQSNVAQFLEEHPDISPPGLNADSEYVITVTKPRKKV